MATYKKKTKENPTNASMSTINRHITSGNYSKLYLLFGAESYLVNSFRNDLVKALTTDGDNMNYTRYNSDTFNLEAVLSDAITMPFFAEHRVVLVEDSGLFTGSDVEFLNVLDQMPDSNILIFCEREVEKKKKAYLHTSKHEAATIAEFVALDNDTLIKWLSARLAEGNVKVKATVPEKLIQQCGKDVNMYLLKNEAAKLHDYCLEKGVIEDEDVDLLCMNNLENNIFEMCRLISQQKKARALALYNGLLEEKAKPMSIIVLITRQYDQLIQVSELLNEGANVSQIMSRLHIQDFAARQLISICKSYNHNNLIAALDKCHEAFLSVKNGSLTDFNSAENLIISLIG